MGGLTVRFMNQQHSPAKEPNDKCVELRTQLHNKNMLYGIANGKAVLTGSSNPDISTVNKNIQLCKIPQLNCQLCPISTKDCMSGSCCSSSSSGPIAQQPITATKNGCSDWLVDSYWVTKFWWQNKYPFLCKHAWNQNLELKTVDIQWMILDISIIPAIFTHEK